MPPFDASAASVTAVFGGLGALGGMAVLGWFRDEHGRTDVLPVHWAFAVAGTLAGAAAGGLLGLLAGVAVLVAAGNVVPGLLLGWGLNGGDGEPGSAVAALCGIGVTVFSIAALAFAVSSAGVPGPGRLWLMALPAGLVLAGAAAAGDRSFLRPAVVCAGLFTVPPVLLALAAA